MNSLFTQAIKDRASDIHIEPFDKELVVRFRTDGVLTEVVKPPPRLQASIISRIKIMSGLNIAEKRIPQDGRIRTKMGGREIDVRVSTMPVQHGERVVMRLLEKGSVFALEGTGMSETIIRHFRKLIRQPHGIILVGPTGPVRRRRSTRRSKSTLPTKTSLRSKTRSSTSSAASADAGQCQDRPR